VIDCREDFQLPRRGHRQQPGDRIGDRPRTQLRDYILAVHTNFVSDVLWLATFCRRLYLLDPLITTG
jgi:hypothetical protein